jgi:hypothetical protein
MSIPARTFVQFLGELEDGDLTRNLTEAVQDLVGDLEDVRHNQGGKPSGKVTITIDLTDEDGVIEAKSNFVVTKPKRKRSRSLFYPTAENFLTRENPRQQRLPFQDVNDRPEVRNA